MIDPRFQDIDLALESAMLAQADGDEQKILEHLWEVRELSGLIYFDILAQRWNRRPRPVVRKEPLATTDDFLI